MVTFSHRMPWNADLNRLTSAVRRRMESGDEIIDLTASNPTIAELNWPAGELEEAMQKAAGERYVPHPAGSIRAREAVAEELLTRGESVAPEDLILSASTSEAYSWIFKAIADGGDEVLTAVPSYPLLENLARLENVEPRFFALEFDRCWRVHVDVVSREMTSRTRAVVVVNPNNPTGNYLRCGEQSELAALCASRSCALISDEVFFDYPLDPAIRPVSSAEVAGDCLTFALGGLSKSAGLPQLKLAWIRLAGPDELRGRARAVIESIADTYLSVATPVQAALPDLFAIGKKLRSSVHERIQTNLSELKAVFDETGAARVLPVEGGWSAVIRVPSMMPDEDLALHLLESAGVLVHPGYFFDFSGDGFLVVSLLVPPDAFHEGVTRTAGAIDALVA